MEDKHVVGDGTFYCRHQDGSIVRYREEDGGLFLMNQEEDEIEMIQESEIEIQIKKRLLNKGEKSTSQLEQDLKHYKEYQKTTNRLMDPLSSILEQDYWIHNLNSYRESDFKSFKMEILHSIKRRREKRILSFYESENPSKKKTKNQELRLNQDEYDIYKINKDFGK
jgi:hypothetical protein